MTPVPLLLASASPRRSSLLAELGVRFAVVVPRVDESARPGESARAHVARLADAKAASASRLTTTPALVLAADTTVSLGGAILGKPRDGEEALEMIRALAGRTHEVLTACRLTRTDDPSTAACVAVSRVSFRPWDEALARWYVATGEPFDKAGGYALQGRGVLLTSGIEGSWSNVVGLPLEELPGLFRAVGDDVFARLAVDRPKGR